MLTEFLKYEDRVWLTLAILFGILVLTVLIRKYRKVKAARKEWEELKEYAPVGLIPKRRLSVIEWIICIIAVLLLIPLVASPRLMLYFAAFVFPVGLVIYLFIWFSKGIKRDKRAITVPRRMRLDSKQQKPTKMQHHWTITTAEPHDPPKEKKD